MESHGTVDPVIDYPVLWLFQAFPEFLPEYVSEVDAIGAPETYSVYYEWVNKPLRVWLKTGKEEALLKRMFTLLERLATSGDKDALNLLGTGVLEGLPRTEPELSIAFKHALPATRDMLESILNFEERQPPTLDASRIRDSLLEVMKSASQRSSNPIFVKGALSWLRGKGVRDFAASVRPSELTYPLRQNDLQRLVSFHAQEAAEHLETGDLRAADENTKLAQYYLNRQT